MLSDVDVGYRAVDFEKK